MFDIALSPLFHLTGIISLRSSLAHSHKDWIFLQATSAQNRKISSICNVTMVSERAEECTETAPARSLRN